MKTNYTEACFAATPARSQRSDSIDLLPTFNTVENLKSCVASLYRFSPGPLYFDRDDKLSFMLLASLVDSIRGRRGSVKSLSVANFQNFYPLISSEFFCKGTFIETFDCFPARSAATNESAFFERVARKKTLPLATYKKVDDNFKKGFKCTD